MAIHDLSGLLLMVKGRALERGVFEPARNLSFVRRIDGTHWDEFVYRTFTPLRDELQYELEGPYTYTVLLRCSEDRMLVVAEASNIVAALIESDLAAIFGVNLYNVHVDIHTLVKRVVEGRRPNGKEIPYTLSFVHARIPAGRQFVRAVSFWGTDLPQAAIFSNHLETLSCTNCGLKLKDAESELVRLSSNGVVYFSGLSKLKDIERVVGLLRELELMTTLGQTVLGAATDAETLFAALNEEPRD